MAKAAAMPALFVSHGAPDLLLDEEAPAHRFLAGIAAQLPRPTAIVCASAHWCTPSPQVDGHPAPPTIHDFAGFPEALFRLAYPAPGSPDLATRVAGLVTAAGLSCSVSARGFDHGVWVPLRLMYPRADIPVVSLALQPRLGAAHHLALGRALAQLRDEGVLVVGSGSSSHNLAEIAVGEPTPSWVASFDDWLVGRAQAGDADALIDWQRRAPHARENHPSDEHFLPLLVACGAGGPGARGRALHRSTTYGVLAMTCIAFG